MLQRKGNPDAANVGAEVKKEVDSKNTTTKKSRRKASAGDFVSLNECTPLEAARFYAKRGWPALPVRYDRDDCKIGFYKGVGFNDATTDPEGIDYYFRKKYPNAQIAIPMGETSDVFVVDLDNKEPGKDGMATWDEWIAEHGSVETLSAKSPKGRHLYFKDRDGIRSVSLNKIGPGIEIKGQGSCVTVAPSQRPDGRYMWENDCEPAEPPQWLVDKILNARPPTTSKTPSSSADPVPPHIKAGTRGRSIDPADNFPDNNRPTIEAALAVIDPDLPETEWFKVCCALKKELGDAGFQLFDKWSAGGEKYQPDKTNKKWVTTKRYNHNIATLFHMANEADPDWRRNIAKEKPSESEEASPDPAKPADPKPRNYDIVCASDIVMRPKNWLWKGHLLRGALELLTGPPGLGKSQVQCSFIACATTGKQWPDGAASGPPVDVIMVTAEDALDQEVKPRLIAAGADLTRVKILRKIRRDQKMRMFLIKEDIDTLAQVIADVGNVGLVTLDPITAYMGKTDSHRTTDVRDQLGPLAEMAERTQVAFSAITHPPKAASSKAIDHFIGSQAFIAAARIGHLCTAEIADGKPTGRKLFTNPKNNPHTTMPTLAFRIREVVVGKDDDTNENIAAPHIVWEEGTVPINADQAVAAAHAGGRPGRKNEAKAFLQRILAAGPLPVKEIYDEAAGNGLSQNQLKRAKSDLPITAQKVGIGKEGYWIWTLGLEDM